jgi:hypothetical protein
MAPPQTYGELPPWPGDSESTVLEYIEKVKYTFDQAPKALEKLNMLKNDVLGNAAKAEQYAADWSALQQTLVNEPVNDITVMRGGLDAYWTGNAKDAFSDYTIATLGTMNKNSSVFQGMANALGGCTKIVYSTYAEGVGIIGKLASDLVGTAGDKKLELIADLLQAFINTITSLISKSLDIIGQYKKEGVSFRSQADGMQAIAPPHPAVNQLDNWDVRSVS